MNLDAKMNRRLLVMGALVLAIGVILIFRLWTLQIIQHDQFQERADNNLRRIATTTAIRGRIFDREGRELVTNRPTMAVVAPALRIDDYEAFQNLSVDTDNEHDNARNQAIIDWVNLLADTLNMDTEDVVRNLTTTREGPLELRLLAIDVSMETVSYITEHRSKFEGVEIEARAVREYPHGSVAAHILGYTGNISDAELDLEAFADYVPSDIVGKTGVERSFEHVLQGVRGTRVLEVNAQGRLQHVVEETEPAAGQDIYLTIDLYIQKATELALRNALQAAHREGYTGAQAGSAVVMEVETGEVLALASYPTYYPEEFIGGISQERWAALTDEDAHNPLNNRAISSAYPPASTFKSFMAIAAMDRLDWTANTTNVCTGTWTGFGDQWPWHCWRRHGHGPMNLYNAISYSCNVPFYSIGATFHARGFEDEGETAGVELQEVVRTFGYGRRTGIDLPGESPGRVPDPDWKYQWNRDFPEYRRWVAGDTVNFSIGQGDVLATPLQVAYSHLPIANGGKSLRPQILHSVRDSRGELVHQVEPELSENQPEVSEEALAVLQESLRLVITRGTGLNAFRGFQVPVAGKTGTAEVGRVINSETGERDQDGHSWFVGYAPAHDPQYVVAVMIENAGGGGAIAAPATRQILGEIFDIEEEWVRARDESR
jgi:penicillin-binding protein 2